MVVGPRHCRVGLIVSDQRILEKTVRRPSIHLVRIEEHSPKAREGGNGKVNTHTQKKVTLDERAMEIRRGIIHFGERETENGTREKEKEQFGRTSGTLFQGAVSLRSTQFVVSKAKGVMQVAPILSKNVRAAKTFFRLLSHATMVARFWTKLAKCVVLPPGAAHISKSTSPGFGSKAWPTKTEGRF